MYPKLHFIHQDIVGALYGSRAIDKTLSKKSLDNLFAQAVYFAVVDDVATIFCIHKCHLVAVLASLKKYP
jgi:hypothetical protein